MSPDASMSPPRRRFSLGKDFLLNHLGFWILATLLLSPLIFKIRLPGSLVVHPFIPILIAAWGWILYASADTFFRRDRG